MQIDRRKFIQRLSGAALSLPTMYGLSSCSDKSSQPVVSVTTKNWIWSRPNPETWTEDGWKKSLDRAKLAGVDAVLVQSCTNRDSLFPHPNKMIPMQRDIMVKAAQIAHQVGMEFHAWMWTMPCDNPQIIGAHPDWYAVNGLGQPAHTHPAYVDYYKFLDPSHPEVQEFVRGNVAALAAIPEVDGVHLDYVRMPDVILAEALQPKYDIVQDKEYPEYDYNYSEHARRLFKEQTGIDPLKDLESPSENEAWRQFRYDSVTDLVNGLLVPEARKANKLITAAVFPNWQSVRQQWHRWDLDGFLPMLYNGFYNRDVDFIEEKTRESKALLSYDAPIYSGIYLPDIPAAKMASAYQAMRNGGGSGIALFSLEDMTEESWKAFEKARSSV